MIYVLLVEDDPAHADAIKRAFQMTGSRAELKHVYSMAEFRQSVAEKQPDIAIMDLNLPDGNADDVLMYINGSPGFPMIVMTSFGNQELAARIIKAGALDYLVKTAAVFADMPHCVNRALREWNLICQKKKAEEAIRESEQLYHSLFVNMLNGFAFCKMIYKEGRPVDFEYLVVNEMFEKLTGLKNASDRKVSEVIPGIQESNPELFEIYGRVAATGAPEKFESYIPVLDKWFSISVYSPKSGFFVALFDVITEKKKAELVIRKSQRLLNDMGKMAKIGGWELDLKTKDLEWTEEVYRIHELELDYKPCLIEAINFYTPSSRPVIANAVREALENGAPFNHELEIETAKGNRRWVHAIGRRDNDGNKVLGTFQDITDRVTSEQSLRKAQSMLYETERTAKIGGWEFDVNTLDQIWTDEVYRIHEVDKSFKPTVSSGIEFYAPSSKPLIKEAVKRAIELGEPFDIEAQIITEKRNIKWVRAVGKVDREKSKVYGSFQDISDRKNKEIEVAMIAREWQVTFDAMNDVVWILDRDFKVAKSNKASDGFFKKSGPEIIGQKCYQLMHDMSGPVENCPAFKSQKSLRRETLETWHKDKWIEASVDPILDEDGKFIGAVHIVSDITNRKNYEEALRQSEEQFRSLFDHSPDSIIIIALDGTIKEVNFATLAMAGFTRGELIGKSIQELDPISSDDLPAIMAHFKSMLEGNIIPIYEISLTRKDGERRAIETHNSLVKKNGEIVAMQVICRDVTDRKRVEKALRSSEEQLRQSQKMEAIGRLAGGIAHDFNNMLTVINNYAEFAMGKLRDEDPLRKDLGEILLAGERSAALTRQLLAFSRKQALIPEALDLNQIILDIEPMFRRLIGEDITLTNHLAEGLYRIKADSSQVEQVLMNLVVNSRDAMPRGGRLTIETSNIEIEDEEDESCKNISPGKYVMLSVTDTGTGIDEATKEHIFEPFYTTKELGKGTGLGLSTVYGIVNQSGGAIWVYSELGKGTSFKIYFPRELSEPQTQFAERKKPDYYIGTESIMIVEDEQGVLNLIKRVLDSMGYTVYTAKNGGEALILCEQHANEIDMIITDIVMPDMSGQELAQRLKNICPSVKTLYMSGYTENAVFHQDVRERKINFISKPFSLHSLKSKIRDVLDSD